MSEDIVEKSDSANPREQQKVKILNEPQKWQITTNPKMRSNSPNQQEQLVKMANCKPLQMELAQSYQSECFTFDKYLHSTLHGYVCKVSKIDIEHHDNEQLRKHLQGSEGFNVPKSRLLQKFKEFPSVCFVQCSVQFPLIPQCTITKRETVPKCIFREKRILKKLSKNHTDNFISKYVSHWQTLGDFAMYYLATEYCESGRDYGSCKGMNLTEFFATIVYPENVNPIEQHRKKADAFPSDQCQTEIGSTRWNVIRHLFAEIVRCVIWLHKQRVAHLNISLNNWMIAGGSVKKPKIKLVDFGTAQDFTDKESLVDQKKFEKGFFNLRVGNEFYMAPEVRDVATSGKLYNAYAADLWSVGVCLWKMIFNEFPFLKRLSYELIQKDDDYLWTEMKKQCLLSMVTKDAFDVLHRIFQSADKRITAAGLINSPFCQQH